MNMGFSRQRWLLALVMCVAMTVAACSGGGNAGGTPGGEPTGTGASQVPSGSAAAGVPTGGQAVAGGTVVWAEPPGAAPDYIWPFVAPQFFGGNNVEFFQPLMYRPLYWFGVGEKPELNTAKSLARPPVYTDGGKVITITLKPYKWSDGTDVTATDVAFWLNMMKAEKTNWAAYVPGAIPDNIASVKVDSPSQITLTLNRGYSQQWYTFNQLSQITPMPKAWDRTAAGPSDCATTLSDCPAVYSYLNDQSKDLSTYATSSLWGVVDGPWKLSAFNADGHVTMVPNPSYSGPDKAKIAKFEEVPFTTDTSEYNVLRAGSTIQVGYIPPEDIAAPTTDPTVAGPNPLSANYYLVPWIAYGINYIVPNFNNPEMGAVFKQLYFRQAFQHLIDQQAIIKAAMKGYGHMTTGPVPLVPESDLVSPKGHSDPYPFDIGAAKKLLTSHGWNTSTTPATCAQPGTGPDQCGAGVAAGQALTVTLLYPSGSAGTDTTMQSVKSNASQAGITVDLKSAPVSTVLAQATACKPAQKTCSWQLVSWGTGWGYRPDFYPTGGEIFATGAGSNTGSYSDPVNDANIVATHTTSGTGVLHTYSDYLSEQLPVFWMPRADHQLTEVANNLRGVAPQSVYGAITPEDWYYVK